MEIVITLVVGVAIGIYIASQVKCHIRRSIQKNTMCRNLNNYENKKSIAN